jgi:hypothetical protein
VPQVLLEVVAHPGEDHEKDEDVTDHTTAGTA